jgi:trypsin-like peptidase/effector-associated domain 1 (EAD1)-containing protein
MPSGRELIRIRDALAEAFDQTDLDELVVVAFDKNLANVTGPGSLDKQAFDLIQWTTRRGVLPDLVREAARMRPKMGEWQELLDLYGPEPQVSIQSAGTPRAAAGRMSPSSLEAIVKPRLPSVDMGLWRERYASVEGQVCRVEVGGAAVGTGFLIGPDLVLTNYHVLESVIADPRRAPSVVFRFDYKRLADGTVMQGTTAAFAKSGWLVDSAGYSTAEGEGEPDRSTPTPDELDFVVVRLAQSIGSAPAGPRAGFGAAKRGWVVCPDAQPPMPKGAPLLIAQHPQGEPIKLAMDLDAVLGLNRNATRVRYATNTEPGSSGSPCFDMNWTLVAMHHMGDPAWANPQYNEGIPIGLIAARLATRGALATR